MIHFSMGSGARPRHGKILPQDCEIRLLTAEEGLVASGLGRNGDSLILNVTAPARLAGDYTGPASSAYLYYTVNLKYWTKGLDLKIAP